MRSTLYGTRLYLRLIEVEDLKNRVKWINDPLVQHTLHYDFPTSLARTQKWFDSIIMDKSRVEFSVFNIKNNEPIGFCGFINIDMSARKAEHHIVIGNQSYWGNGYGTETYIIMTNYGFLELGLSRIYGYQNLDNHAAYSIIKKIGWTIEGTLRQDLYAHGKIYDRRIVSILRAEWENNPIYDV